MTSNRATTPSRESLTLAILTVVVALVAAGMVGSGRASALEGVSFVTGAICVWLTVKENVWNFPMGALNAATFSVVFFQARLFGDAGLQIVYVVLNLAGWYMWLYGGDENTALRLARASAIERAVMGASITICTLILWKTLHFVGGSSSFWDAATTSASLGAQWWMNRKRVETWHLWIVVDILYVPLYFYRGLALTGLLYAVFLVMAVLGLQHWTATWKAARDEGQRREEP